MLVFLAQSVREGKAFYSLVAVFRQRIPRIFLTLGTDFRRVSIVTASVKNRSDVESAICNKRILFFPSSSI